MGLLLLETGQQCDDSFLNGRSHLCFGLQELEGYMLSARLKGDEGKLVCKEGVTSV